MIDPVTLTRELVRIRTINPPGDERRCLDVLARILAEAGFGCVVHPTNEGRGNLVAEIGASDGPGALCFTGHVDTVPLGSAPWSRDPFAGEIVDGRLYGRGTTDMKAGIACFVAAACALAERASDRAGLKLIITSAEETGCEGAVALADSGALGAGGLLVIAEPTANLVMSGHKGALWLKAAFTGVTAHGSMPELGVNAAFKAARALAALDGFRFPAEAHPLGLPSLNVGTFHAGANINSVPDLAEIGLDMRSTPGLAHRTMREIMQERLGDEAEITTLIDLPPLWTDPADPWLRKVREITSQVTGERSHPEAAVPYFTDGSVLKGALGNVPSVVLGPGEPGMAHKTDEYCEIGKIEQATEIYGRLITAWLA